MFELTKFLNRKKPSPHNSSTRKNSSISKFKKFPFSHDNKKDLTDDELKELLMLPSYENIEQLTIDSNKITKIPDLAKFKELRKIIITNCSKLITPPNLNMLKNLEELTIKNSGIYEFPDIDGCDKLEIITVNGCDNLNYIPDFNNCSNLRKINFNDNEINRMPNLLKCINLEEIHAMHNRFDTSDDNVVQLTKENFPKLKTAKLDWIRKHKKPELINSAELRKNKELTKKLGAELGKRRSSISAKIARAESAERKRAAASIERRRAAESLAEKRKPLNKYDWDSLRANAPNYKKLMANGKFIKGKLNLAFLNM